MTNGTIIVAREKPALEEQIIDILATAPNMQYFGSFSTAINTSTKIEMRNSDAILVDFNFSAVSGIDCLAFIEELKSSVQVVMLIAGGNSKRILKIVKADAIGHLAKPNSREQTLDPVPDKCTSSVEMFGSAASTTVPHITEKISSLNRVENLTSRELQVLDLLSMGLTYNEVSTKLNIGYETVRTHVKKFCLKLHSRNRIEAVVKYRSKSG